MSASDGDIEKKGATTVAPASDATMPAYGEATADEHGVGEVNPLKRSLQGRHMQMIAIGGSIGAGLFVSTGSALQTGGPGSLTLGYLIVGAFLLLTIQALGELAVLYPVNGAFFSYCVRFISPAWGFAVGWDYAISWLVILPFEITAASLTIKFWRDDLNMGIWVAVFLVVLSAIQFFGVRGYGEVEFVLGLIKVIAVIGFIILGVVIDCGGAPKGGYIGAHYWHDPGAFTTFKGFCSVFTTAAFAFSGTELAGLAAAEAANPAKSLPKATKQVFWRIMVFYLLSTFIVGLIVPSNADYLLGASGSNTKASPLCRLHPECCVANSATFGSTRTIQALAERGMAPKFFAYIDKAGRPLWCVLLQIAFGFLAFINEASATGGVIFNWLLALSGIGALFVWGSICYAHIRFRAAWKYHGRDIKELAFVAPFGVIGSWIGVFLACLCLIAEFYVSIAPKDAEVFFENYLAAPVIILLFIGWVVYTHFNKDPTLDRGAWLVPLEKIDILSNMRDGALDVDLPPKVEYATWGEWFKAAPLRIVRSLF
ncbi:amino-acid permease [Penicillium maclennaniae]|uniref:amino-acid permease n=1 Tax=Penicillium maclennaniae TaxID=1343394 RepID=UPI00254170CB|nr:amino-acid permease [Penicillium maclennaniae]KAJ5677286.1 amino-acid permease [Penicillium maclennaniae]